MLSKQFIIIIFILPSICFAQTKIDTLVFLKHTTVKDQQNSGTCWSFATTSFIESEILRINNIEDIDLSEMFFVYYNYLEKIQRYYLVEGNMFWTPGGQAHDVFKIIENKGICLENYYPAYTTTNKGHDHTKLDTALSKISRKCLKEKHLNNCLSQFIDTLNFYLTEPPEFLEFQNKTFTTKQLAQILQINPQNYVTLTSFFHHPYYKNIVLEDKFNWACENYFNTPWDVLETACDSALYNGYTVLWNGDVTETGFDYKKGFLTINYTVKDIEKERLNLFFSHKTQIDHLMHIVGVATINGKIFYIVKNSWGKIGKYQGYLFMSKNYFRLKTVSITINKNALTNSLKKFF